MTEVEGLLMIIERLETMFILTTLSFLAIICTQFVMIYYLGKRHKEST